MVAMNFVIIARSVNKRKDAKSFSGLAGGNRSPKDTQNHPTDSARNIEILVLPPCKALLV
jgi:hypothetical protein